MKIDIRITQSAAFARMLYFSTVKTLAKYLFFNALLSTVKCKNLGFAFEAGNVQKVILSTMKRVWPSIFFFLIAF